MSLYAAVEPNNQPGECGPYYIWYQTGPDEFSAPSDFVDLYSITFDLTDVVDDFDLVSFTGSRIALDHNQDGISDWNFYNLEDNQLTWIPQSGQVRIIQRGCWSSKFHDKCGYAMISIQPKPRSRNGSARIPIHVTRKCSQTDADCSETYYAFHEYTNCRTPSLPDLIIRHESGTVTYENGRYLTRFDITIENTTDDLQNTDVITSMLKESLDGEMFLYYINIDCPTKATCEIIKMNNTQFTIALGDIPKQKEVIISYQMAIDKDSILHGEKSYFTNTATLSNGESDPVTISISGTGDEEDRRKERPWEGGR